MKRVDRKRGNVDCSMLPQTKRDDGFDLGESSGRKRHQILMSGCLLCIVSYCADKLN
jgi:hypothetical protein